MGEIHFANNSVTLSVDGVVVQDNFNTPASPDRIQAEENRKLTEADSQKAIYRLRNDVASVRNSVGLLASGLKTVWKTKIRADLQKDASGPYFSVLLTSANNPNGLIIVECTRPQADECVEIKLEDVKTSNDYQHDVYIERNTASQVKGALKLFEAFKPFFAKAKQKN